MAQEPNQQPIPPELRFQVKLPQQVRAQIDAVDAMMREMQPPGEGDPNQPEEPDPNEPEEPGGEPEPGEPEGEDTWEQRARSAHGRLEQALRANDEMARRVRELEAQMTLRATQPSPVPAAAPAAPPQLVTPEERNDYGEEFIDVVGRRAREVYAPEFETLAKRLERIEAAQNAVGKVVEGTQKSTLYTTLSEQVPDWREINHHPAFHQWLAFPDPYSGIKRHDMLNEAFSRHDTARVVNFFAGFLAEATGTPPNQQQPARPAPNGNGNGRPSLEEFAAPGRARSGQQPLPPDKPTYTQAGIAAFYDDRRRGKWRGREAEAEAIDRDIYQAQHEGRIIG